MPSYKVNKKAQKRKGNILIIMGFSMFMMLGFCAISIDYGIAQVDANHLQRACDAAALAGASKLKQRAALSAVPAGVCTVGDDCDKYLAREEAKRVALQNGVTITDANITFPLSSTSPKAWYDNSRIVVRGTASRPYLFARIFGPAFNKSNFTRQATAEVSPLSAVGGAVPLVITTQDYLKYSSGTAFKVQLERMQDGNDFDSSDTNAAKSPSLPYGEAIAIDTDPTNNGKSPSWWEDGVRDGVAGQTKLGVSYNSDTAINANLGNQSDRAAEALEEAANSRMQRAAALGWLGTSATDTYFPNYPDSARPRIFTIMVADATPSTTRGNNYIAVKSFAVVYLVDTYEYGQGSARRIEMTFRILPRDAYSSDNPSNIIGIPGPEAEPANLGPTTLRLIDDIG